jgi:hypothetical protein
MATKSLSEIMPRRHQWPSAAKPDRADAPHYAAQMKDGSIENQSSQRN